MFYAYDERASRSVGCSWGHCCWVSGSCLARKTLSTRNSIMLMYEALMHHLVRRHIAGAGFDPTTMARLSVLRDIYGMPVHTRTSRKTRPLMPSSPTCFLGLKDATWLTTGWTFWQWYGVSFILTEGRFI